MFLQHKTEGFVFKKEDRLEADRIFSVFTRDFGRVEIVGKAIRKMASKLKSGIEIFYLSKMEFIQGEHRKTLKDAVLIKKFKNIEKTPEKLGVAYKIVNTFDNFIKEQEKDERILGLVTDVFQKIDDYFPATGNYSIVYYYFFWNFVSLLGYGPELYQCSVCQGKLSPHSLYFSYKEGGVICKGCYFTKSDALKISSDIVKILRLIFKKEWDILKRLKTDKISQKTLQELSQNYHFYLASSNYFKT